jgi:hypothetical protein
VSREAGEKTLHVRPVLVPRDQAVHGESVSEVVQARLVPSLLRTDADVLAQSPKGLFDRMPGCTLTILVDKERSIVTPDMTCLSAIRIVFCENFA